MTPAIARFPTLTASRRILAMLGTASLLGLLPVHAHAWFFFIPGSVTSAIADKLSGAEGENCVAESVKVGDTVVSSSGNTGIVRSLSGTTSRCANKSLPVRALVDLTYTYKATATLELPAGFVAGPISSVQRWDGISLRAENRTNQTGVILLSRKRTPRFDATAAAHQYSESMSRTLDDVKIENQETPIVEGLKTIRYELTGKTRAGLGRAFTYLVTVFEGEEEVAIVSAYAGQGDFAGEREALKKVAAGIRGIAVMASPAVDAAKDAATVTAPAVVAPPVAATPPTPQAAGSSMPTDFTPSTGKVVPATALQTDAPTPSAPSPSAPAPSSPVAGATATPSAIGSKLRELESLRREGILSQGEFDAKKAELLKAF